MGPDSRVLVRKGRKQAEAYYRTYKDPITTSELVKQMASVMQEFTQSGYVFLRFPHTSGNKFLI